LEDKGRRQLYRTSGLLISIIRTGADTTISCFQASIYDSPDKEEESIWYTLDGFLCKEEQVNDIKTLAALHARMPHDIARAVLVVPEKLRDYVSYAYDSVQDPHSDYAVQMRSACRAKHEAFVVAVDSLAPDDRQWFVKKIFDPSDCRAIAVPEAD
jgi:hypothetical protein